MPSARRAISSAAVPEETPSAYLVPQNSAKACSNRSSSGPSVKAESRPIRSTVSISSANSSGKALSRRMKGTLVPSVAASESGLDPATALMPAAPRWLSVRAR